ncbi:MAG TPA: hypothetical protein VFV58_32660 [Blastocatellia bacterium]|nr:hypothetical protein [Blastocatellia bacterium]
MIIQVDNNRVAYDGRDWTPVAGEHAWAIARMMKTRERLYKLPAAAHPDFAYNVAQAAAKDFHGRIIEYQPIAEYIARKIDTNVLNGKKTRLYKLRNGIGDILQTLTGLLTLNIRESEFDRSLVRIVRSIEEIPGSP